MGIIKPFVFAELKKFIPLWLASDKTEIDDDLDPESGQKAMDLRKELGLSTPKKATSTMSFTQWMAAFEPYAVAAAATGQWNFVASWTHKSVVIRIASDMTLNGGRGQTGVAVPVRFKHVLLRCLRCLQ